MFILPLLMAVDTVGLYASFWIAFRLRFEIPYLPVVPEPLGTTYQSVAAFVTMAGVVSLLTNGTYPRSGPVLRYVQGQGGRVVRSMLMMAVISIAATSSFREFLLPAGHLAVSRLVIAMYSVVSVVMLGGWRWLLGRSLNLLRKNGLGLSRILVIGHGSAGERFCRAILNQPSLGYFPVGTFSLHTEPVDDTTHENARCLPHWQGRERLEGVLRTVAASEVVCVLPDLSDEDVVHIIDACRKTDVRLSFVPNLTDVLLAPAYVLEVAGYPLFVPKQDVLRGWNRRGKRLLDIVVSATLLLLLSPLLLLLCCAIELTSRGGVLFCQERVGRGGETFLIYKFRSMSDGDQMAPSRGPTGRLDEERERRVTAVGRLMRRFSLDELPQLLNVLKGDMSLVGPRPHIPEEVESYADWQRRKLEVLPGITGLTQVSGRKDLSLEDMVRLDIYYVENWSVWLDLKILARTLPVVLNGRGAY